MAMLNLRLAEPAILLDIARLPELSNIRVVDNKVEVGAAVPRTGSRIGRNLARDCRSSPRAAVRRPFPDPQQRDRVRFDRACRSVLGIAALAGDAGRRGGAALTSRHARGRRAGFPTRHADDRARAGRIDHRRAFSDAIDAAGGVPRGRAAARRFRHYRGCRGHRWQKRAARRHRRRHRQAGGAECNDRWRRRCAHVLRCARLGA